MNRNSLDKKIFGTLFFSIFAAVTGVGIVVPLLPVFANELGASGFYIGMIFGAFSISRTVFLPYFGRLSDRKGRKTFIIWGLFAYAVVSAAFMISDTIESLITIRFFHGIASAMVMPVSQAYIGDITPEGREGLTMGLFNMSMFASLSLGPVLGGVIKDSFSLQASFGCMGALALIGFFLSALFLPPRNSETVISKPSNPAPWHELLKDRGLSGLFAFRLVYTTCIGIIWCFLPILGDTEFSLSSSAIGVLVMLGVLTGGILHTPMGFIADKADKKKMVCLGGVIVAIAMASIFYARGFWDIFTSVCAFGIGGGIAIPALMAMAVIKGNEMKAMGSVMAIITMAHSLGMLVGSLLAGLTMDYMDLKTAFPAGSVIMAAGIAVFLFFTSGQSIGKVK